MPKVADPRAEAVAALGSGASAAGVEGDTGSAPGGDLGRGGGTIPDGSLRADAPSVSRPVASGALTVGRGAPGPDRSWSATAGPRFAAAFTPEVTGSTVAGPATTATSRMTACRPPPSPDPKTSQTNVRNPLNRTTPSPNGRSQLVRRGDDRTGAGRATSKGVSVNPLADAAPLRTIKKALSDAALLSVTCSSVPNSAEVGNDVTLRRRGRGPETPVEAIVQVLP